MSASTLLGYLLFVSAAVLLPGIALQRLARVRVHAALVIPLGGAFCAGAYWLALVLAQPWLFPGFVLLTVLTLTPPLARRWGHARPADRRQGPPTPAWRSLLPSLLTLLAFLAVAQFPFNRTNANGDFVLDPLVPFDSAFHVGLTRELVLGHPPQIPGVSGFPISYHLGTDLVRAAALRWAGTDPWDSLTRLDVLVWAIGLALALRAIAVRLGAPPLAVAFVPWTLLLTDFSFVFAGNPQAHWWADLLRGNLLVSLACANPVVPALGLTLGTLLALERHLAYGARGDLLLAALQALALPFFKVFLGAQLLLGLGFAFLFARGGRRGGRWALLVVALPAALATAGLVLGPGGETVRVSLAPLDLVAITRETLGLPALDGLRLVAFAVPWLLASLGLRLSGLKDAVRALRASVLASALSAMALCGWPLGLLFRVSAPEMLEGQKLVNDAAYLVEQSGPLLWIFAAMALARFATTRRRRGLALAAVLLLAMPATVQYAVKKATSRPDRLPAAMVRATLDLERASQPGDVVLQRPGARYPPAPVILAGRRVPYERFTPYLTQFASRQALEARHEVVYRFFHTTDRAEAVAIARSLDARFLALYGADRVRFATSGLLEPVHEEDGARVYRLRLEP